MRGLRAGQYDSRKRRWLFYASGKRRWLKFADRYLAHHAGARVVCEERDGEALLVRRGRRWHGCASGDLKTGPRKKRVCECECMSVVRVPTTPNKQTCAPTGTGFRTHRRGFVSVSFEATWENPSVRETGTAEGIGSARRLRDVSHDGDAALFNPKFTRTPLLVGSVRCTG